MELLLGEDCILVRYITEIQQNKFLQYGQLGCWFSSSAINKNEDPSVQAARLDYKKIKAKFLKNPKEL